MFDYPADIRKAIYTANASGETEVHVFKGEVDLRSGLDARVFEKSQRIKACQVGMVDSQGGLSTRKIKYQAKRFEMTGVHWQSSAKPVYITLTEQDRFLTLMVTDGGKAADESKANFGDLGLFAEPVLILGPDVNKKRRWDATAKSLKNVATASTLQNRGVKKLLTLASDGGDSVWLPENTN